MHRPKFHCALIVWVWLVMSQVHQALSPPPLNDHNNQSSDHSSTFLINLHIKAHTSVQSLVIGLGNKPITAIS